MENPIIPRIGSFFIFIGLGLLFLFVVSVLGRESHYEYLFLSAISLVLGTLFRRRKPQAESTRFSTIRKVSQRRGEKQGEKRSKEDLKK